MVFLASLSTAVTRSVQMTTLSTGSSPVGARMYLIHIHLLTIEIFSISVFISFKEILRCFGHNPCVTLLSDRGFFLHKQPHNPCNNKPESFSIPSCLLAFYFDLPFILKWLLHLYLNEIDVSDIFITTDNLPSQIQDRFPCYS